MLKGELETELDSLTNRLTAYSLPDRSSECLPEQARGLGTLNEGWAEDGRLRSDIFSLSARQRVYPKPGYTWQPDRSVVLQKDDDNFMALSELVHCLTQKLIL
jgi:hypothetical protein